MPGGHHQPSYRDPGDRRAQRRRLTIALGFAASYMLAEAIGGWLTGSLALLADAGHMLSDVAALALSLFAIWFAQKPASPERTYGYYRIEILAALANGAALGTVAVMILFEAVQRLGSPRPVLAGPMMAVAAGGLAVNALGLWILWGGRDSNLNVRGAWLHVLSDALGSIGALAAGALIWTLEWQWADPAASVLIALLIVRASWTLLREAVAVLMEGAPGHIDVDQVRAAICGLDGVESTHDLHVWAITSGMVALSCHVCSNGSRPSQVLLAEIQRLLDKRFAIHHATIQIEPEGFEESRLHP